MEKCEERLSAVRMQLKARFVERSAVVDGALTAVIAKDHCLMLGPPGTAKSDFAETIADCIGRTFFEIQLTKDTAPEEVFGMFSAKKMIEDDRYERRIDGVAPSCQVWFLDEIWKSSSALLNGFLLAMQQRVMRNGTEMLALPLETVFAASNEYPEDGLEALYDRFGLRFWLDYIGDQDALCSLLVDGPKEVTAEMEVDDLDQLRGLAAKIPWGSAEAKTLLSIKSAVEDVGFVASDRTWIAKAPRLIRARAVVNGHDRIQPQDYLVLADSLWQRHTDRPTLLRAVGNAADPYGSRAASIIDGVRTAMRDLPSLEDVKSGRLTKPEAASVMGKIQGELSGRRDAIAEVHDTVPDNEAVAEAVKTVDLALEQLANRGREITMYRPVS